MLLSPGDGDGQWHTPQEQKKNRQRVFPGVRRNFLLAVRKQLSGKQKPQGTPTTLPKFSLSFSVPLGAAILRTGEQWAGYCRCPLPHRQVLCHRSNRVRRTVWGQIPSTSPLIQLSCCLCRSVPGLNRNPRNHTGDGGSHPQGKLGSSTLGGGGGSKLALPCMTAVWPPGGGVILPIGCPGKNT